MGVIGTDIGKAAFYLKNDEVVAIPTETVYGLAGSVFSAKAVASVYSVKGRPSTNPLIIHVASVEQVEELVADFPEEARMLAAAYWPGPITLVLPKKPVVPDYITAGQSTVAIRIPDHPLTLSLLQHCGLPLAAPSANPYNYISPVTALQVYEMLGDKIPYILDGGKCGRGIESTILHCTGTGIQLLRPGALAVEKIESVLDKPLSANLAAKPAHPGMHKVHYSPGKSLELVQPGMLNSNDLEEGTGLLLFRDRLENYPAELQRILSESGNTDEAAGNLYDFLYVLDHQKDCHRIIAELLPETGIGTAVNDRLRKAASIG